MSSDTQNENKDEKEQNASQKKRSAPPRPPRRPAKQQREEDAPWGKFGKLILSWITVIIALLLFIWVFRLNEETEYEISFSTFQELLNEQKFSDATIKITGYTIYDLHGKLKEPMDIQTASGKIAKNAGRVTLTLPYTNLDESLVNFWASKNLKFSVEKDENLWMNALMYLPWILIIGIWLIYFRRMQGGGAGGGAKGLFSFGKSRAKLLTEGLMQVTFANVAGADEAKIELQEVIEFLREPGKFRRLGGKIPKGVLLLGPPGTGKTLMARAVAGEAGVPFFSISGADFVEMFVGVGASRVRDLFEQGKRSAPCIIFIDEIDAVGRHRGAGIGGGHDEREQTLNQLLVEMDGFEQNTGVIIIAATNRPDVLDPALLRPGRFDRQVVVDRPDMRGREGIFRVHTKEIPLHDDVRIDVLAKGTPGLSGADIANLVNEAALLAARQNCQVVSMHHFEEAKDKVMMGTERKSMIISDREKKTTSYHESGHVLVARFLPEADPVHKVTIIPRGRALGVTTYLPIDEKHSYSREYLEAMITYMLGGRAAEKLVFKQFTTGAGNDIERATELARKMVCEWGMSEKLGPMSYGAKEEELFLGREITKTRNFSENTAIAIDTEVKSIVISAMKRADKILKDNIKVLHRLANALLEREILDSEEIDKVIRGEELPPIEKHINGAPEPAAKPPAAAAPPKPKESVTQQSASSEEKKS